MPAAVTDDEVLPTDDKRHILGPAELVSRPRGAPVEGKKRRFADPATGCLPDVPTASIKAPSLRNAAPSEPAEPP